MKMSAVYISFLVILVILFKINHVMSHGYLIVPAERSSRWRTESYPGPINYDDNQLYCGGKQRQWEVNDGKCGVCGDPYDAEEKPNEDVDGLYVLNSPVTGSYVTGGIIATSAHITAYHRGWFEFRLCPLQNATTKVTQECLNQTVLHVANETTTRIELESFFNTTGPGFYNLSLQLPSNVTCDRCVLQWRYNTGNSWGCEPDPNNQSVPLCCIGCGKQENFVNCADIEIRSNATTSNSTTSITTTSTTNTTTTSTTTNTPITTTTTSSSSSFNTATTTETTTNTPTTNETTTNTPTTTETTTNTPATTETTTNTPTTTEATTNTPTETTPNTPTTTETTTNTPTTTETTTNTPTTTTTDTSTRSSTTADNYTQCSNNATLRCKVTQAYSSSNTMHAWCCTNCNAGHCPPTHCGCKTTTSTTNTQITSTLPSSSNTSTTTTTTNTSTTTTTNTPTTSTLPSSSNTSTTTTTTTNTSTTSTFPTSANTSTTTTTSSATNTSTTQSTTSTTADNYTQCSNNALRCKVTQAYSSSNTMHAWCCTNCIVLYCPSTHCLCVK